MNIPNRISLVRICLIPVYLVFMYQESSWFTLFAGLVFVIASLTDSLDGYIARKNNMVTDLGKFLDPLADKLLVLTAIILLCSFGRIPAWAVVVITARELVVMSLRTMAALKHRVLAADIYGKIKTVTQLVSVAAMHFEELADLSAFTKIVNVIFYISVAMTIFSGINYVYKNSDVIQE